MYKDVWKRFGTKILMVLCSVLLLGGVAIAVPRLQASVSMSNVRVVENEDEANNYLSTATSGGNLETGGRSNGDNYSFRYGIAFRRYEYNNNI